MKKLLIILMALMLLPLASAELFENQSTDSNVGSGASALNIMAQTFTVGSTGRNLTFNITKVGFRLYKIGSGGGIATFYLFNTTGTNPQNEANNSILALGTIDASTITAVTTGLWYNITFSEFTLDRGERYTLGMAVPSGDGSNRVFWMTNNTANQADTYPDGNAFSSNNNGTTWVNQAGDRHRTFEVYGNAESSLEVNLNLPANNSNALDSIVVFNATTTPIEGNLTNSTILLFNSTGLYNQTTIIMAGNVINESIFNIPITNLDVYTWNVETCMNKSAGGTSCAEALSNFTFAYGFDEKDINFTQTILETSSDTLILNITVIENITVQNAELFYNGSSQGLATKVEFNSSDFILSNDITIPSIVGTINQLQDFFWNITFADVNTGDTITIPSETATQNVTELIFNLCGLGNANSGVLNFTLVDEITGVDINAATNATSFEASFQIGANNDAKIKNFTISNLSVAENDFAFCVGAASDVLFGDMTSLYSAVDYLESSYVLDDAILNGSNMNEIDLFLLPEASGIQFFITVKENFFNLEGATVQIAKFFIGEGLYKTVEIDVTDNSGKISAYLELDREYRFTVVKNGEVAGIFDRTAICEEAPCEMVLTITEDASNIFSAFDDAFADNVLYNLSFDPINDLVTFDFVDTTGLATSFTMTIWSLSANQTSQLISNQTVFTSSGSLSYNTTSLGDGDYFVEVFVQRSPFQLIDVLHFLLGDFAGDLGLLGLFFFLLILCTVIFGVSLRSPELFVMGIPLAISTAKIMGFVSIAWSFVAATWVLAIVSAFVIAGGRK